MLGQTAGAIALELPFCQLAGLLGMAGLVSVGASRRSALILVDRRESSWD